MNLQQAKKEFSRRCLSMNLSKNTIEQYEKVLKRFLATCVTDGLGADETEIELADVTTNLIRLHLATLAQTLSPVTVKIHYMALHSFFTFLYREGMTTKNIMGSIERPKVPKNEIKAFSKDEINKLLSAFDKNDFIGYRNYVITCTLFATGIRRSELLSIKKTDIRFDSCLIKIMGKGEKFRNVPITESLRALFLKYIRVRQQYIKTSKLYESQFFFISRQGNKLKANSLTNLYENIGKQENMQDVRVSPHTFRHTFAKFFLLNGGDVFTLQKILGHSDLSVTKKYVTLNDNEIKAQNDKFNPFENENWRYY